MKYVQVLLLRCWESDAGKASSRGPVATTLLLAKGCIDNKTKIETVIHAKCHFRELFNGI